VIVKTSELDARQIKENLDKLKNADKTKRLEVLKKSKKELISDAKNIKKEIIKTTDALLSAKSSALSLSAVMDKYQDKLKRDKLSRLRLVDRVAAKNQLKAKLIDEIQGIRTRATSYQELSKVDKSVIVKIVGDIKKQLHLS